MSSRWCAYFDKTDPKEYCFLDFYEYRSKQVDFTFSFQKESYKLQMDLDNLMKDGSEESKETAMISRGSSYSYGDNGMLSTLWSECPLLENGTLTTTGTMECCLPYGRNGHRDTFCDVNAFWNKIELNRRLQDQLQTAEVEATNNNRNRKSQKRSAEEASPIVTPPPNLRDRSPSPSYYNGNNSLDDYDEESAEKTNDYESDVEIIRKEDDNPFDVRKDEGSTKYKVVLSWRHAIDNMVINNVSGNDWVTRDGHNISIDFRNFQLKSIEKLEADPSLSYAKEIDLILCLSSIMYCNELKPKYVECSQKAWNEARPRSLIPKELPTVADLAIIEYSRLLNDKQLLDTKWRNNWAKGNTLLTDEDKDIFDCVQIVSRNFFTYLSSVSYDEDKKLDEDTFVHRYCHQTLEEIFNKIELSLVWANGESESSKERRLLDGHNHGRKPDFRILSKIDDTEREFVFGEIKPPHCPNTINKTIVKLAEFMKGSLDFIIDIHGYVAGLETYELKPIGSEIKIFSIDLVYDGLYRFNLLSKVLFPTESANFVNIVTVVSTLYSLLSSVSPALSVTPQMPIPTPINGQSDEDDTPEKF
ncbi:4450_t:CDS:10, partial [Ambispora leptoticha]